ncbi:hypothetical protein HDU88_002500 [Geranomyces variabilis]|nr:hypothetical protein HDU88_002500 [Geranomyces variabilis]
MTQWLALNKLAPGAAAQIAVPYFQVYGNTAEFSVLFRFESDLFATHQFAEVQFPCTDSDSSEIFRMCAACLTMRNMMERSADTIKRQLPKPGFRPAVMPGLPNRLLAAEVHTPRKDKKDKRGKKPLLE